ncbi:flagellar hook assembly protein FlgD [Ideonella sp. BN130291]|uniref:flagellar hook assembly protein FlgD n=1 Tax=Ideonella sp. BN130291 TaxID=3112940 RepID=UPI002E273EB5|nr:flagellar hook capping FlgD N-terminal domain-containing protein [Ideonella sp. BN130291]
MAVDLSTLNTSVTNPSTLLGGTTTATQNDAGSADRFLKLLVAQMQNQDPLNPMDNAQVTSQMAQINTVNGIEKLNTTVSGLNGQFVQMQALQAASLVGREVWLEGNALQMSNGTGEGAFNLSSAADRVKVEVLSPAGQVVDTMELGAETAGRHSFTWSKAGVSDSAGLTFRVSATSGAAQVPATALMLDTVESAGIDGDTLTLELARTGDVPYSKVLAVH